MSKPTVLLMGVLIFQRFSNSTFMYMTRSFEGKRLSGFNSFSLSRSLPSRNQCSLVTTNSVEMFPPHLDQISSDRSKQSIYVVFFDLNQSEPRAAYHGRRESLKYGSANTSCTLSALSKSRQLSSLFNASSPRTIFDDLGPVSCKAKQSKHR